MSLWDIFLDRSPDSNYRRIKKMDQTIERLRSSQMDSSRTRSNLADRVEELELDLARALLLLEALVKVVQAKNLITEEELAVAIRDLDLADGTADGMKTRERPASAGPADAYEHLRQLEKQNPGTPSEFLRDLENDADG